MPLIFILVDLLEQLLFICVLYHMTLVLVTWFLDDWTHHVIFGLFGLLLSALLCKTDLLLKIFP